MSRFGFWAVWVLLHWTSSLAHGAGDGSETNHLDPTIQKPIAAGEELKQFRVPQDFLVELVAAEPQVINPITIALDERDRIYVSESHTYRYGPNGSPVKPYRNPIIRLEPRSDGTLERVIVADGFEDPVMGIAIRDGKMWTTSNNHLYQFELPETGPATNRKQLVQDSVGAWNPFGMYVLEFGPDGLLYMSVGNHDAQLAGPTNKIHVRRSSGMVLRMRPDGSDLELLTQGFRAPYAFEFDPFGQLWVLSNGEGNPNRFVRVIDGVDYHCYTRDVDYGWLAGTHPHSPPVFELPGGSHTQLLRYYGAAYPEEYRGNLLLDNWGRHGFGGANRAIFRYVLDANNAITAKAPFVSCGDPHFRPSHMALDSEGNLLLADWYGRDDESDLTGRIWRVRYTRPNSGQASRHAGTPPSVYRQNPPQNKPVSAKLEESSVETLGEQARTCSDPVVASTALWALLRANTPESTVAIAAGTQHADWRVRKLAMNLLRRCGAPNAARIAAGLQQDPNLSVRSEAARSLGSPAAVCMAMFGILQAGGAEDSHLRYECAWHIAKNADARVLDRLLASRDPNVQLSGRVAIDIVRYDNFATQPLAIEALRKRLEVASADELEPLLALARDYGDASLVPALVKIAGRTDLPVAVAGRALFAIKRLPENRPRQGSQAPVAPGAPTNKSEPGGSQFEAPERFATSGRRLLEAVSNGQVKIESQSDWLLLYELIACEGPTSFSLGKLRGQLDRNDQTLRGGAHELVRSFGSKAAPLVPRLWQIALQQDMGTFQRMDSLLTLTRVEAAPNLANWEKMLGDPLSILRREAVRSWRLFGSQSGAKEILLRHAGALVQTDASLQSELEIVLAQLGASPAELAAFGPWERVTDKSTIAERTLAALGKISGDEHRWSALAGRNVFERVGCVQCHTTIEAHSTKAPLLKGIGAAQKHPYLIESVLFPSNIVKTGFETESIQTSDGRVMVGLVRDDGDYLRVFNATEEVSILKKDIEARRVQKLSIMPEGQEKLLSPGEFVDLVEYLSSLK
jgi:putative membrane-bound dehydrogenase-like protein